MKTYLIELTAEQLKIISQALIIMDQSMASVPLYDVPEHFGETLWKVSDAMEDYYNDNGITDGKEHEPKTCSSCSGSGYYDDDGSPPCGACNGTGLT